VQPSLNTPRTFGALIRQYRVAASLTQGALGERAHLSATTIAALERGRRLTPRPGTVLLLAEALQLTLTEEADLIAAATGSPSRGSNTSGLPIASTSPIGIDRELRDINGAHGSTRLRKRTLAETKSTVGEVLGQIEQHLFVGRKVELRTFVDWLDAPALHKPILEVSGPGGVGKSVLLSAYRRHAVAAGRKVVLADGRGFPSTEDGLIRALGGTTLADVIARSRAEPGLVPDAGQLRTIAGVESLSARPSAA
jgi:transcriptional regulator with XRE-family HTH domain